jgi:hypothetical protein
MGVLTAGLVPASAPQCPRPGIDPEATRIDTIHTAASVATFVAWTARPVIASRRDAQPWFRRVSAVFAATSVVGLVFAGITTQRNSAQRGIAQRVFLASVFGWQLIASLAGDQPE